MKNNIFKQTRLYKILFLVVVTVMGLFVSIYYPINYSRTSYYKTRFEEGIKDCLVADVSKLHPLVNLDSTDLLADIEGDYVYLLSFDEIEIDETNQEKQILKDKLMTVCELELFSFLNRNINEIDDYSIRFKELFGLPIDSNNHKFTLVKTKLENAFRPAYVRNVTKEMSIDFVEEKYPQGYMDWFNSYAVKCFTKKYRIWSRLGYTYDYNHEVKSYGLSEFAIEADSEIEIIYEKTIREFVDYFKQVKEL